MTHPSAQTLSRPPSNLLGMPGLRTLRSREFRIVVAAALASVGAVALASVLARQAADPRGQYAIDFTDYHRAAQRIAAGESPYAPEMLTGPIDAQGLDRYRYPPPLAQMLLPTAGMPRDSAALLWLAAQAAAVAAATWLAVRAGSTRAPSIEALCWAAAAAVYFMPVFDTLWKGNVSGFLALLVLMAALGPRVAGIGTAAAALLKVVPLVLVTGLAARGRQALLGCVVTGTAVAAISFVLAPQAWLDYLAVLPNLLLGGADYPTNLAPATILSQSGFPDWVSGLARAITILAALWCMVAAWRIARQPGGLRAAVTLGTAAMLLLPAALWYHYLVVLLPLGVLAWFSGDLRSRALLLTGGAMISLGLASLWLALLGGLLLVLGALRSFAPQPHTTPTGTTALAPGLP